MIDRRIAPPFVKSATFLLPRPATFQLSNGVRLHSIEGVQQDILKIELLFKAGKWFESKIGQSHFTAQMMERGTATMTSAQLAETFDRYGAHIEITPGLDFIAISLYSLTRNLDRVMPAFLEMLKAPSFPEHELSHMKKVFLETLRVNNEKNSFLASKALRKNLFGSTHPYGSSMEQEHVNSLTAADLRHYFEECIIPSEIVVVSKGDPATIESVVGFMSSFASTPSNTRVHVSPASQPFFEKINKANSVQSSVRLGKKTISRSHKDYFDLLFLNHILGGYFGSRLMKNIREEKGLTYGIQSSVSALMNESFMVIGADVNKENEGLIFEEIRKEIFDLQTREIEEGELESAKGHFAGGLQSETANPFSVAEKVKTIKLFSLPEEYYQQMLDRVYEITPQELLRTAQLYLNDNEFYKIAVG